MYDTPSAYLVFSKGGEIIGMIQAAENTAGWAYRVVLHWLATLWAFAGLFDVFQVLSASFAYPIRHDFPFLDRGAEAW